MINVLSLFDGMSCGQIALDRLGIKVNNYYASEIDKYAVQVTQANYPNTIQLGDVRNINSKDLPKIDLLMGGSPCQDLSFANTKGKGLEGERSNLFFEYVRLLDEVKPKFFLLENVRMKKENLEKITEILGVPPILINSSLVSAQSRQRYYWTNIPNIQQPQDRNIVLRDILETETDERPVKDTKRNQRHYKKEDEKSLCMTATMYKGAGNNGMTLVPIKPKQVGIATDIKGHDILRRVYSQDGKSPTLNSMGGGNREPKVAVSSKRHEIIEKNLGDRITDDTLIIGSSQKNAYLGKDKSSSLTEAMGKGGGHVPMVRGKDSVAVNEDLTWRKLTPLECERLQTVPDNYTNHVSNTRRYAMLGNGWTVEVIKHILSNAFCRDNVIPNERVNVNNPKQEEFNF